jgi:phenylalanyl-tRNA synthetase alpha subunit
MGNGGPWTKKPINKIQDSFLEALRELSGKNNSPQTPPSSEFPETPSLEAKKYKQLFFQERSLRKEEHVLRIRSEQETKARIHALREELKRFAATHAKIENEVKVTILQAETTAPDGTYYVSFLEQLKDFLYKMSRDAETAANWLAAFNKRNKKKGYYWGQVKRKGGGSNFYLSGERYMATQAG